MPQNPNAVAPAPDSVASPIIDVTGIAGREDVERIEATVSLPAAFQYVIPGRKKLGNQWVDDNKVGITADGYDYINRVLGVSFYLPSEVPSPDTGTMTGNPFIRPDRIYLRMGAVWYNETGQMVGAQEDLDVDYGHVYASARLEAYGSELVLDEQTGLPLMDDRGNPVVRLPWDQTPDRDGKVKEDPNKKPMKALMQLRTHGLRYAQTVGRTRLLKIATGVRSLPLQQPRPFNLHVVGYRDRMTPLERAKKAKTAVEALYGGRPVVRPQTVTPEVLEAIEAVPVDDTLNQELEGVLGLGPEQADDEFNFAPK